VFVVVHHPTDSPSKLPRILSRAGALPATHATDGEPIEPGHIYVAPPDQHLLVRDGFVEVSSGPPEHRLRPAVDPLFRSAAEVYGARVIGVVLSGNLEDGAAGLATIKARGGQAVVQDPANAEYNGMPRNAVAHVAPDHVVPLAELATLLTQLITTRCG
jgi:two-component system chemotaxis response regulator CheB